MYHYYIQKGHSIKELGSLSRLEKLFLIASMELYCEEVKKANE